MGHAAAQAAVIQRPLELTDGMAPPSMEVERERVRIAATEDIAAAREWPLTTESTPVPRGYSNPG